MDASTAYHGADNMEIGGMDMDIEGYVFAAARTKPANTNKYAKRVGANHTQKLELDDRSE